MRPHMAVRIYTKCTTVCMNADLHTHSQTCSSNTTRHVNITSALSLSLTHTCIHTRICADTHKHTCADTLKLILLVRKDLEMSPGKIAAQCSHATLGAYRQTAEADPMVLNSWELTGEAVIVLGVSSEEEMRDLVAKGQRAGLQTHIVRDAGRTEVAPSTATVAAIGPALASKIDAVTGHLSLF